MWAISGILIVGGILTYMEAPYLVRKKLIKELCFFLGLLFIGVTLVILETLRIQLPNPLDWITAINEPISDLITRMLS
ncbi:hypothetical protein ASG89_27785 [Paenibacillus sp. Soil766]|uniref:hypothetical protein n=1 Tax=Paenibacillus sp. Soil766 TaxID=1736404 RepID=UPI00070DE11D|nr:hypothetical protein [Paenibacillus sp. Soil766]KRE99365.1 hypothetical protein ASG89_27785 [Paenibacillus sp. Soil766]